MTPLAPPAGDDEQHLRETTLRSEQVFAGHFLNVRLDQVTLPDGAIAKREYIVHPGAVMIVPLLDDGRVVVERQWRHPLARVMLEFPAGKLDAGEAPLHCAIRELTEETGYRATEWARAGILHNAIAYSTEGIEIWFAADIDAVRHRVHIRDSKGNRDRFVPLPEVTLGVLRRVNISASIWRKNPLR